MISLLLDHRPCNLQFPTLITVEDKSHGNPSRAVIHLKEDGKSSNVDGIDQHARSSTLEAELTSLVLGLDV